MIYLPSVPEALGLIISTKEGEKEGGRGEREGKKEGRKKKKQAFLQSQHLGNRGKRTSSRSSSTVY